MRRPYTIAFRKNYLKALFLACGGVTFYRFNIGKIDIPRVDNSSQLATKASGHGILTCYLYSAWSRCISQEGQVGFGFAFKTKSDFCVSQFRPVFVAQLYFDPSLFYRFDHLLLSSFKATPKRYLTLPFNFICRMLLWTLYDCVRTFTEYTKVYYLVAIYVIELPLTPRHLFI